MKKIIIIGSSGYIGSYLYQNLLKNNEYNIIGYDIKPSLYTNYIKKGCDVDVTDADIVIYLAGISRRLLCENDSWENIYNNNIIDIMEVGKKMTEKQLLIYASTAGVLEGSYNNPANENYDVQENLLDKYSLSMFEREKMIKKLSTRTIGLRFGTVIGISPMQRHDLVHVAMIKFAYLNCNIEVSYPKCYRAILDIMDLYKSIKAIINNNSFNNNHNVYNLASFNTTIEEIAKDISKITNIPYKIIKDDNSMKGFSIDNNKFINTYNIELNSNNYILINNLKENIGYICINEEYIEKNCRVCKKSNLTTIIDLGYQPLANNFVEKPIIQSTYPLCLIRCKDCNHTQLNYTIKPEVMFRNYQYNSGTSQTLRNYFKELAIECIKDSGIINGGNVLEIACNDCSQLDEFKKLGWNTFGVDPAINLVKEGIKNGHTIHCGFWGTEMIDFPQPDIILAQNVLAHVPDPILFLQSCYNFMNENTILYIQTSQCNMYINGEFDTIYHEHLSYFTISSMMKAADLSSLCIKSITKKNIHGTSYFFKMMKKSLICKNHSEELINEENYSDIFYNNYRNKIQEIKLWVHETINMCVKNGFKIIAYGAAAKGMTILNYFNILNIEYIIDDAIMKHYKYTPGSNIVIKPIDVISDEDNICIIVLAWNFIDEIISNIQKLRKDKNKVTNIIQVFPNQKIFRL